jgi:GTP-binding protein EngB required for normal cell division
MGAFFLLAHSSRCAIVSLVNSGHPERDRDNQGADTMKNASAIAIARKMLKIDIDAWKREGFHGKMSTDCEWADRTICELVGRKMREQSLSNVRRAYESIMRSMA